MGNTCASSSTPHADHVKQDHVEQDHFESVDISTTTHLVVFAHGLTQTVTKGNLCHGLTLGEVLRELGDQAMGVELVYSVANASGCSSTALGP